MGVNKVDLSTGETLIDISNDTVSEEVLVQGYTAHNSEGEEVVGALLAGDMLKNEYDKNNNRQVDKADDADKFGGQLPSYYAKKIDLDNKVDNSEFEDVVSEITQIAEGKCASYVFDTVSDLDYWISNTQNTSNLKIGDVFLIRAVNVPDYWWDGNTKQILETTKVDLTNIDADTVDGKHIVVASSAPTTNNTNIITFVV